MGHNAAVDLAAAVRWKPCNCNFPRLPFFVLLLNTDMIIYELSEFHDPWALEAWVTASMRFPRYTAVNEKISPPFIIQEELTVLQIHVFTRWQRLTAAGPPPWGRVYLEVSRHLGKDHTYTNTQEGGNLHKFLSDGDCKHIFDHILVQM